MSYSRQPEHEDEAIPRPRPRMTPERSSSRRSMYRVSSGAAYASVLPFSAANRTPSPDDPIYVDPNRLSRLSTYSNHTTYSSSAQATSSRPLPPPPPPQEPQPDSAPSALPPAPPAHSRNPSYTPAAAVALPPVSSLPAAAPIHSRQSSYEPELDMNRYPDTSYDPHPVDARYDGYGHMPPAQPFQRDSWTSHTGLTGASAPPYGYSAGYSARNSAFEPARPASFNHAWPDDGRGDLGMGLIDPMNIEDDGDDGFGDQPRHRSRSPLAPGIPLTKQARDTSGNYDSLQDGGSQDPEKSAWLKHETGSNKKLKWRVAGLILFTIVLGTILGVIGVVLTNRDNSKKDSDDGADLTKDSASIKALMNNKDLHKVFPGMDYTPLNAQYPDCIHNMPSQNNITKDIAVLSQLTPAVRLYGTDCNQTEMVLHAIDVLDLKDKMKVWMGVWIDESNQTTSDRQLDQMYKIFDTYGADPFSGVIVGNEVIFRTVDAEKASAKTQLGNLLTSVRTNLTAKNINLPVATSDLGDTWDKDLAAATDVVMSNVHPFFGGVPVDQAAGWTWTFWQTHDVVLTGTSKKQIVSEVGWPSGGGQNCVSNGQSVDCASKSDGSVAGISQLNQFMGDFICQSLTNGTDFFWFEAFDEPWKVRYNTGSHQWEDKWGLLDVNRNLKSGVKIPDCGSQNLA